jgi:hypothetical protein
MDFAGISETNEKTEKSYQKITSKVYINYKII